MPQQKFWLPLIILIGLEVGTPLSPVQADSGADVGRIQANSNRSPAGVLADGVLTVKLDVEEAEWFPEDEHGPSLRIFALAEAGKQAKVPGPMIRAPQGTNIHVSVHNRLTRKIVMHGMHSRPGRAEDVLEIPPSETRDVTFLAGEPGAYYYWATAGGDTLDGRPYKEDSQLYGALIIDPAGDVAPDRVFVIGVWRDRLRPEESFDIPVINGKSWPYTERLEYKVGADVRWRWLNPSGHVHPMHLHGSYFRVDSIGDGEHDTSFTGAQQKLVATQLMPVGGTMTMDWQPKEPGRWLFHCHILTHVSPDTMFFHHNQKIDHSSMSNSDPVNDMSGLVMGITILPGVGQRTQSKPPKPLRKLQLVITNQDGGVNPRGYALSEQGKAAAGVSAPGPALVLTQGEPVAVRVTNRLTEATSVHWHGIELQSYFDGVPGWAGYRDKPTPMIQPGKSFDVYFNPPRAGTFIYHTHMNDLSQLSSGLYGPIIVLPPGETFHPETDKVFLISRNGMRKDGELLLNGAATAQPQEWRARIQYRLRFIDINANNTIVVTLSQKGVPVLWKSLAKDGADLPLEQAIMRPASFVIAPGETYDFQVVPEPVGNLELKLHLVLLNETITQTMYVQPADSR